MKRFLLQILIFCTIIFCIAAICDYAISKKILTSGERLWLSWSGIYADTTYHDVVINGNSRAWTQYDPHIIDSILSVNSYNFGINGSPINRQIIKYHKYCEMHRHPRLLIQNIDLWTMGVRNGYEREQFFPYFIFDRKLMSDVDKYEKFSFFEKYIPMYRYCGYWEVIQLTMSIIHPALYKGYKKKKKRWTISDSISTDISITHDSVMIKEFCNFIEKEYHDSVQIVFVYAPMYHDILDHCKDRDILFSMYDSIADLYDIKILNFLESPICYDTCYFYNRMHLNRDGAEYFSKQLADSLKIIIE